MAEHPWLTIVGLGEDGPDGLSAASLAALNSAEIVMGPARHLALLPDLTCEQIEWPVPFADGIDRLLALKGQKVVVLASGDPFWFGAGSVLARHLDCDEWTALSGISCFALTASRLGWPLETTTCLGLHAAPLSRLRAHLAPGARVIATLRDANGPKSLAAYLSNEGFGESRLHVMEALGGPRERVTTILASEIAEAAPFSHPLCIAIDICGDGPVLPTVSGLADTWFEHDGQITKRPVRALTLSALAPRPGEHLWDIGGGSGSIAIEWLLSHCSLKATTIEADPVRADRIKQNAARLGVERLNVIEGSAPNALVGLERPNVVFVGGGLSEELLGHLTSLEPATRLVANGVTLEAEALLAKAHEKHGGDLMRIDLSSAAELGSKRAWRASYPIVQWSVVL